MGASRSGPVLIAGAGIGGLAAALAFARRGFAVRVFERAAKLEEAGAGVQLSPNATRLLRRLGVLDRLLPHAVSPEAVVLRDAATLSELARVPMGKSAEQRWGAPYLAIHRADLQQALLDAASSEPRVEIHTGAEVAGVSFDADSISARLSAPSANDAEASEKPRGSLLIGADGVRSAVRQAASLGESRFAGQIAWRAMIGGDVAGLLDPRTVTAFLHRRVHLVAYPLRGGRNVNLAAIMKGRAQTVQDYQNADALFTAFASAEPRLKALVEGAEPWSAWPIHVARSERWTDARGLALIGDAAHAMTPFAAQGAAMAIEDAVVLADLVAAAPGDLPVALARYEEVRRPRVARVARRGRLNHLAWHAWGPVAVVRNAVLKLRPPERLAADLDWLYGWNGDG